MKQARRPADDPSAVTDSEEIHNPNNFSGSRLNTFLRRMVAGLCLGWVGISYSALAQGGQEPVSLSVVTVRGYAAERFLAGQKVQPLDSTTLAQFRYQSLTDLLALNTPLLFKNYGPGQLATVSFRGTSASHTAVLWNGVNINQPMAGLTDFSTIPVAGFDQLSVQYGSAASVVGSDAVGGSILLKTMPDFTKSGLSVFAGHQQGSFRNHQSQGGARYTGRLGSQWQVAGKTVVYGSQLNNRYPYPERKYYYLEPTETRQRGLLQDLYFRNRQGRQVSVNAWLTDNDLVQAPADTIGRERTRTQNYRLMGTYEASHTTVRVGWFRDVLDYAKGDFSRPSHSLMDRLMTRVEHERLLLSGLSLRVGAEASHYRTQVDGYGGQVVQENRADLYALTRYQGRRWLVSANLRQGFATGYRAPFTPSIGGEYQLIRQAAWQLTAKGSVGRSYRVPTLNERYWLNLGNPALKPEQGINAEAGLAARTTTAKAWQLTAELTTYRNRVKDWTYWNPTRNYRVENLQEVLARGVEWNGSATYTQGRWQAGMRAGYAYTRSTQERVYDVYAQDVVGKQLVYVPLHTGNLSAFVKRGPTRLTIQTLLNTKQYITFDNIQALPAYTLTNVLLNTHWQWGAVLGQVQGQINNVFDVLYLNVRRNAMPGRNYALSLFLTVNTNKNAKL